MKKHIRLMETFFLHLVRHGSCLKADILYDRKLIEAVTQWIDRKQYLDSDRSLEMEAASMGISAKELSNFFRFKYKEPFLSFRARLRVNDAQEMIRLHPDLPMQVIAEMCGFSDRRNFERYFLKYVGDTPARWRKKVCGNRWVNSVRK